MHDDEPDPTPQSWTWDDRKARANYSKHGVSFETASLALGDPFAFAVPDPHPDDDRWRTIGKAIGTTLFVVHTLLEPEGPGRIISARRATSTERRQYETLRAQRHHA